MEETRTSQDLLDEFLNKFKEEELENIVKNVEKDLQKKYSKSKGKNIEVGIYCTICTKNFMIKGKNNKSVADSKQVCPHIISKSWEVKHNE